MKRNNIEFILIIFILIISCVILVLLFIGKTDNQALDNVVKSGANIESEKLSLIFYLKQNIYESVINENVIINLPEDLRKLRNTTSSNKPILIFSYSAFSCDICIEFGLNKLEEYFREYKNNDNLFVVVSGYPAEYKLDFNLINLNKSRLNLPIEDSNQPFYFVLVDNQVQNIFVPEKNYAEYTDTYLSAVKSKYF